MLKGTQAGDVRGGLRVDPTRPARPTVVEEPVPVFPQNHGGGRGGTHPGLQSQHHHRRQVLHIWTGNASLLSLVLPTPSYLDVLGLHGLMIFLFCNLRKLIGAVKLVLFKNKSF